MKKAHPGYRGKYPTEKSSYRKPLPWSRKIAWILLSFFAVGLAVIPVIGLLS